VHTALLIHRRDSREPSSLFAIAVRAQLPLNLLAVELAEVDSRLPGAAMLFLYC